MSVFNRRKNALKELTSERMPGVEAGALPGILQYDLKLNEGEDVLHTAGGSEGPAAAMVFEYGRMLKNER